MKSQLKSKTWAVSHPLICVCFKFFIFTDGESLPVSCILRDENTKQKKVKPEKSPMESKPLFRTKEQIEMSGAYVRDKYMPGKYSKISHVIEAN